MLEEIILGRVFPSCTNAHTCLYMYECVYVLVWIFMYVWYMCTWGAVPLFACGSQRRTTSVLLYPSPPYSFGNVPLTEPRPKQADKTQKPFFFCPHNAEVINRLAQSHFAFCMVLGIWTQLLTLVQQHSYLLSHLPALPVNCNKTKWNSGFYFPYTIISQNRERNIYCNQTHHYS